MQPGEDLNGTEFTQHFTILIIIVSFVFQTVGVFWFKTFIFS